MAWLFSRVRRDFSAGDTDLLLKVAENEFSSL